MTRCTDLLDEPTVIIGSGPAALTCAETLRKEGYKSHIIMITKDDTLPYDRKKLSKKMTHDINEYIFRQETFFEKYGIKVWLNTTVTKIDVEKKTVYCNDGKPITYSNLVLAMGSTNKIFKLPGSNLEGIYYLRDYHDAEVLYSQIKRKHVTIVGSGFEGLEICSTIDDIASSVTLLARSSHPLKYLGAGLGKEINQVL
uniref:FAD/NAD(P)-binding domain-containing protein n=1 Tax=Acrobeloides nanus TaxID=290746 RepID=A0A914CBD3_9BILA